MKKMFLLLVLVVIGMCSAVSALTHITDCAGLQNMNNDLTEDYVLDNNIDCSATSGWNAGDGFEPIGTSVTKFTGSFEGNDYNITGLFINRPTEYNLGLFGFMDGVIQNVHLVDVDITGNRYVGALVSYLGVFSEGNLVNCSSTGSVSGSLSDVGGLVGYLSSGTVTDCFSTCSVSGSSDVGGLVGENRGTIHSCYSSPGSTLVGNNGGTITASLPNPDQHKTTDVNFAVDLPSILTYTGATVGTVTNNVLNITNSDNGQYISTVSTSNGDYNLSFWVYGFTDDDGNGYREVRTCEDLQAIDDFIDSDYELDNNIDCDVSPYNTGDGFDPIGDSSAKFINAFNGSGYNITGLYINRSTTDYVGLFARTYTGATIDNVRLVDADITGKDNVGALVGYAYGTTISNCSSTGSVSGYSYDDKIGGLVGYIKSGTVTDSSSTCSVSGLDNVGGLVGYIGSGTVTSCYSTGSVSASSTPVGALVGENHGTINNCYSAPGSTLVRSNAGTITNCLPNYDPIKTIEENITVADLPSILTYYGATVGTMTNNVLNITNSDNGEYISTLDTSNGYYNRSFVVYAFTDDDEDGYKEIRTCEDLQAIKDFLDYNYELENNNYCNVSPYNTGAGFEPIGDSSDRFTGAFDGHGYNIIGLYINRSTTDYVGLFGATAEATIDDVGLVDADITGDHPVGCLVGQTGTASLGGTDINNSHCIGSVNGDHNVGGLIGSFIGNSAAEITQSYFSGRVYCAYGTVGGLIGSLGGPSKKVTKCYSTGASIDESVDSDGGSAGGLIGNIAGDQYTDTDMVISDCYSTMHVSGRHLVGGLIGIITRSTNITNCYSTGKVAGSHFQIGGFIGGIWNEEPILITNCYSTGAVSGDSEVGGLIGNFTSTQPLVNSWWYNRTGNGVVSCCGTGTCTDCTLVETESALFDAGHDVYATDAPNWDFVNIWDSTIHGYPVFVWKEQTEPRLMSGASGTNFSVEVDLTNVTDPVIETSDAKIEWSGSEYDVENKDIDIFVNYGDNFVSVDTSMLYTFDDRPATITLYNVTCPVTAISYAEGAYASKEGIIAAGSNCEMDGICSNKVCEGTTLTFDVTHFTGFATGATANLTTEAEAASKSIGESIMFYAWYVNSTDGTPISGECKIKFDDNWGAEFVMNFSGSEHSYNKTGGFIIDGLHEYNVTCINASFTDLEANDTKLVGVIPIPEFSTITLGLGLIAVLAGLVVIRRKK